MQQPPRPVPKDAADEIDDFLRRAAQQRIAQPARAAQPPAAAQSPQPARLPAAGAAAPKPVVAEVVAAAPVGGQVTEHVQKFLDTGEFTRRGDQLGEEVVAQVDREIDQHLHQVFDHSLSQIAATPGETAAPPEAVGVMELPESSATEIPSTFATDLAALLDQLGFDPSCDRAERNYPPPGRSLVMIIPFSHAPSHQRVQWKKTGAAKQRESMRSKMPPWPSTSVP